MRRALRSCLWATAALLVGCQIAAQVDREKIEGQGGGSAQAGAGGLGGSAASGGAPACDPAACPGEDGDCRSRSCEEGRCAFDNARAGTTCTDPANAGAQLCDGLGNCVECLLAGDCPAAEPVCARGECRLATCGDMLHNGAETDVDCGGADCGGCADGATCLEAGDCTSGFCSSGAGGAGGAGGGGICAPCTSPADCPSGQACDAGVCM
jgi:hypothetical protein